MVSVGVRSRVTLWRKQNLGSALPALLRRIFAPVFLTAVVLTLLVSQTRLFFLIRDINGIDSNGNSVDSSSSTASTSSVRNLNQAWAPSPPPTPLPTSITAAAKSPGALHQHQPPQQSAPRQLDGDVREEEEDNMENITAARDYVKSFKTVGRPRPLLFFHIPKTAGTAIEYAAGTNNIAWGSCLFKHKPKRSICRYPAGKECTFF